MKIFSKNGRRPFSRVSSSTAIVAATCIAFGVATSSPAHAVTIDLSSATLNFTFANSVQIGATASTANGGIRKYTNVVTVGGVSVDAVITTALSSATISDYDNPGSAGGTTQMFQIDNTVSAVGGYSSFKFDFYESGTYTGVGSGIPVVLKNVKITSIDLDSPGRQFTDFVGFQKYTFSTGTRLSAYTTNATGGALPTGTVRFIQTRTNTAATGSNLAKDRVQVTFDTMSSYTAVFGNEVSGQGGYFGVQFDGLCVGASDAATCSTQAAVSNPSNTPPTSSNTTKNVVSNTATVLTVADFGNYSDADLNPFDRVKITTLPVGATLEYNNSGTWTAVTLNQEVLVSDIDLGKLRVSTSSGTSIGFKVYDGLVYSTNAYTITIAVTSTGQTITFSNPGTKAPSVTFASGATASSGLTVTLTSKTPGVCTVSGLSISTVTTGTCVIEATQSGDGTYGAATPVTQSFPVNSKTPQTISFTNPGNQTWNGSNITIGTGTTILTATSGLTVTITSYTTGVCTVSGRVITVISTGTCRIRATQAGDATYSEAPYVEWTFEISPPQNAQSQTITVVPATTSTTKGTTISLSSSGSSGTGAKTYFVVSNPSICSITGTTLNALEVGTCDIEVTIGADATYSSATSAAVTITVTPIALTNQTITVVPASVSVPYGNTISLSASGQSGTGDLTYIVATGGTKCSITDDQLTAIEVGTCTITVTIDADGTYNSATSSAVTITITARSLTITADNKSITVGQSAPTFTYALSSALVGSDAISGITFTFGGNGYGPSTTAPTAVNAYTNTPSAAVFSSGSSSNYNIIYIAGTYTISTVTLPVCVAPVINAGTIAKAIIGEAYEWKPSITAGTSTATWAVTSGTLPPGLSLNASTGAITGTPTTKGTYNVTIEATSTQCSSASRTGTVTIELSVIPPGRVAGVAWIDANKNGVRDANESVLPGITVAIQLTTGGPTIATATTDANGAYVFVGLEVGQYSITGTLPTERGLVPTWDTDGGSDWKIKVTVSASSVGKADLAAVGTASIVGKILLWPKFTTVANAPVRCTWFGVDGVLGNADDLVATTSSDANGAYSLQLLPVGKFSCVGSDPLTKSAGHTVTVVLTSTDHAKNVKLYVGKGVAKASGLPVTGVATLQMFGFVFILMGAGIALLSVSRKRHRI